MENNSQEFKSHLWFTKSDFWK